MPIFKVIFPLQIGPEQCPPLSAFFGPFFVSDLGRNGGRNHRETLYLCILPKYTAFEVALVEGGCAFFQGLFSGTLF